MNSNKEVTHLRSEERRNIETGTFIKQRQAEGIAAAKARGQKFSRPCQEQEEKYESLLI